MYLMLAHPVFGKSARAQAAARVWQQSLCDWLTFWPWTYADNGDDDDIPDVFERRLSTPSRCNCQAARAQPWAPFWPQAQADTGQDGDSQVPGMSDVHSTAGTSVRNGRGSMRAANTPWVPHAMGPLGLGSHANPGTLGKVRITILVLLKS